MATNTTNLGLSKPSIDDNVAETIPSLADNFQKIDDKIGEVNESLADMTTQKVENESAVLGSQLIDGTGWTSAGWTGNFVTGFTNGTGNTSPLRRTMGATGTKKYQISFDTSAPLIADELYLSIGNSVTFDLYIGPFTHYEIGIQSVSDGDLVFTPISTFNKTISNITVKEITAPTTTTTQVVNDSTNAKILEFRGTKANLENLFMGLNSGKFNTSGYQNVSLGTKTLENNMSGFWNTGIGSMSLNENTAGSRNTAIGYNTLLKNKTGQRNAAIGTFALSANISGIKNHAFGSDTLYNNTTGSYNVAIGFSAMYSNTIGYRNVAIGNSALNLNSTGDSITVVGASAHRSSTTATRSVAVGASALEYATTGGFNVAVGYQAGRNVTTGQQNIFIGYNVDTPDPTKSNFMNIGNALYGNLSKGYVGIGNNDPGVGSDGSYSGIKLEIGKSDNKGVLNLSFSATATGSEVGIIGFMNHGNADTSGATRKTISYISSSTYTSDNNVSGNSGGELRFFIKPENGALAERMRINSFGNVGIGVTDPTAFLHLKAGGTAAHQSPLKFTAGSLNTTPQNGAIEFDGTNLYITINGTRRTIQVV